MRSRQIHRMTSDETLGVRQICILAHPLGLIFQQRMMLLYDIDFQGLAAYMYQPYSLGVTV